MKKVININFQGRVIPIEETAYEELQKYTESLRKYFAREEGRDEIINDIENRIAELFSEKLKKDPTGCVTDAMLNEVIAGIGRPEDFDGEEVASTSSTATSSTASGATGGQQQAGTTPGWEPRGSWYRNQNDKILGGVASGLANYLRIDPSIVRILFVLFTLGFGSGILLYVIFWIVLPSRPLEFNVRRRLYRNPDQKVLGGVCSGLASYFNVPVLVPRLIFLAPLLLGIIGNIFAHVWWDHDNFGNAVSGGFGGTLFFLYIVLWIVIPFATSASAKLEMRGEKVDLESIKNTVQEDLKDVKGKGKEMGSAIADKAQVLGQEMKERTQSFASEAGPAIRNTGSGVAHAIGMIFKIFFFFIAGVIIFALFVALMAVIFSGAGAYPLSGYLLSGFWQHALAWGTLILFLGVPLVGLMVWLVRRITGVRSNHNYLPWIFGTLWTLGWISMICFGAVMSREFRRVGSVQQEFNMSQPASGRLQVAVDDRDGRFYSLAWFDHDNDNDHGTWPALSANEDTMLLNTIRIKLVRSKDSAYHMYTIKRARSNNAITAEQIASKVEFPIRQADSILYLPSGFTFSKESKFRNQQVIVVIEVPIGKMIRVDHLTDRYGWFYVTSNMNGIRVSDEIEEWNDDRFNWKSDRWYTMSDQGLKQVGHYADDDENNDEDKSNDGNDNNDDNRNNKNYRYRGKNGVDSVDIKINKNDTTVHIKFNAKDNGKNGGKASFEVEEKTKQGTEGADEPKKPAILSRNSISVMDLLKIDA